MDRLQNTEIIRNVRNLSIVLGAVGILIGSLALIGWQFEISSLKASSSNAVAVNPLTAVLFMVIGFWVICYNRKILPTFRLWSPYIVLGVSFIKMFPFLGINLHIDRILYSQKVLSSVPVNAMAPNTLFCFVLLGIAILLADSVFKKRVVSSQWLAIISFCISFVAFLGYIYESPALYGISSFIPMAFYTSIAFMCVSLGVVLSRSTEGIMAVAARATSGGYLWRRSSLIIILMVGFTGEVFILGYENGYYGFESGTIMLVLFLIAIFELLAWNSASSVDKLDIGRINLDIELSKKNEELKELSRRDSERLVSMEETKNAMLNLLDDIAKEKDELHKSLVKNEAILTSIGDGFIYTDNKGVVEMVNDIGLGLLGYKRREDIIGKNMIEILPMETEDGKIVTSNKRPISKALEEATALSSVYNYVLMGGERLPVAVKVTPVILDNNVIGAVEIFRDVRVERQIEKLRTDFLSLVSHQLRTPLSGMKWLLETLAGKILGKLNARQRVYVNNIHEINERMIRLVLDMLSVLRIESGITVLKNEDVNVSLLYKDFSAYIDAAAKAKEVSVRNEIGDAGITVVTDPQLLKSIIDSFLSNAINYSTKGQEIILGIKEGKHDVTFYVKDHGIGIPKEEQSKIFKRFYRASNAKEFKPDGTGLGLYISSMLAEKLGGKIWFESPVPSEVEGKKNKGTTFFLKIPKIVD